MIHVIPKIKLLMRSTICFRVEKRCIGTTKPLFIKQSLEEGDNRKKYKRSSVQDRFDIEDIQNKVTDRQEKRVHRTREVDRTSKLRYAHERACQIMTSTIMVPEASKSKLKPQFYDYYLVLDFEATCEEGKQMEPQVSESR